MRICLIGATHPCHNPRLVREADSLADLGLEVRVVTPSFNPGLMEKDRRLMDGRAWQLEQVRFPWTRFPLSRYGFVRGRQRLAGILAERLRSERLAVHSISPALPELVALAASHPADWFIAHAHGALPVAAAAARLRGARLGFDCEDLLGESFTGAVNPPAAVERRYLGRCAYVSTTSELTARHLSQQYRLRTARVLYNVFPLRLASGLEAPAGRPHGPVLRLHWFGQTIGAGRGLEEAIEAVRCLGKGVELHLRGTVDPGYEGTLGRLIGTDGLRDRITLHPQVDHDALIRTMGEYDVGLALEQPRETNYGLTVTNKLFSYLLAGLAVAVTDTPGQREVFQQFPAAGFLYPPGDVGALIRGLKHWIDDRSALRAAQEEAWNAARERWCWDIEQHAFFGCLGLCGASGGDPRAPAQ